MLTPNAAPFVKLGVSRISIGSQFRRDPQHGRCKLCRCRLTPLPLGSLRGPRQGAYWSARSLRLMAASNIREDNICSRVSIQVRFFVSVDGKDLID